MERKDDVKLPLRFKIDSGFIGKDVAIPANIANLLNLNPLDLISFSTPTGSIKFYTGYNVYLVLSNSTYKVSYIIHKDPSLLISIQFLKNISEMLVTDFTNNNVIILLR